MTLFGTDMHLFTFVIIILQVCILSFQTIHYLSRPSDISRSRFFLLILSYLFYNLFSGLFPDHKLDEQVNFLTQTIIAHLIGVVLSCYFIFYIYKEYDIQPLKLFSVKKVMIILGSLFIPAFVVPFLITDDIMISRWFFLAIPLVLCLIYAFQIIFELRKLKPSTNIIQDHYRMRKVMGYLSVLSFFCLPMIVFIGDYQFIEQPAVNFGFFCLAYSYIKTSIHHSKTEYNLIKSYKENSNTQSTELELTIKLKQLNLTPSQITIAQLILENNTYKTISENIFLSDGTVRKHASNIFKKCNVSSKKQFIDMFKS